MGHSKREDSIREVEQKSIVASEYIFRLYVTGATPNSLRAISNIKSICETYLAGKYSLEIIDVYQYQDQAAQEQIVALPMLIKIGPLPQRKLIGDLSNTKKVLEVLNI